MIPEDEPTKEIKNRKCQLTFSFKTIPEDKFNKKEISIPENESTKQKTLGFLKQKQP